MAEAAVAAPAAQAGPLLQAVFTLHTGTLPPATFTASSGLSGSATGTGAGAAWSIAAGDVILAYDEESGAMKPDTVKARTPRVKFARGVCPDHFLPSRFTVVS